MALGINLYAEFLLNVRSVAVYGELRNRNTENTKAHVSSNQRAISLMYDDRTASITLPLGVTVKSSVGFPITMDPSNLSMRLEITEDHVGSRRFKLDVKIESPWSASSLGNETMIACKNCQSTIVAQGVRVWKDLPRGLWAETLDQWYCHRPEVEGVVQTDYAGSNGPQLVSGIAFIDACHFLFPSEDCQAVKIEDNDLRCDQCSNQLGIVDSQLGGYRLYKWSIQVRHTKATGWEKHEVQNFICAQMLELMEDQNVRKFIVFSGKLAEASDGLLLWVFNPDIKYASSQINEGRPRRAMKIFYERIQTPSVIADKLQLAVEDLPLPFGVLEQLQSDLRTSHDSLPEPAKRTLPAAAMGNWKVALLDRFDEDEPGSPR